MARDHEAAVALVEAAMSRRHWNVADLAREAVVDPATVADFINGNRWPQSKSRGKMEEALALDPGAIGAAAAGRSVVMPASSQMISVEAAIDADDQLSTAQQKEAAKAVVRAMRGTGAPGTHGVNDHDSAAGGR